MASKLSNNDIAKAIYLETKGKTGVALTESLKNVTTFLSRKRLLSKKEEILTSLKKIINKEDGVVSAKVTSVTKLTGRMRAELSDFLKKKYKADEIQLEESLDEGLLGGIRIEAEDEVIDLSVKNKIGQLQEYLTRI